MTERTTSFSAPGQFMATQLQPVTLALDAAPRSAQLLARGRAELLRGVYAGPTQPFLNGRSDAAEVAQFQCVKARGQVGFFEHGETIRLAHVGGGLGQEAVGGDADRAADRRAQAFLDQPLLDASGDRLRIAALALASDRASRELRRWTLPCRAGCNPRWPPSAGGAWRCSVPGAPRAAPDPGTAPSLPRPACPSSRRTPWLRSSPRSRTWWRT